MCDYNMKQLFELARHRTFVLEADEARHFEPKDTLQTVRFCCMRKKTRTRTQIALPRCFILNSVA